MKSAISIKKGNYKSLNSYTVYGSNGSKLYRSKNNYKYKNSPYKINEYIVLGMVNGKVVYIECKDYRSARNLFMAMQ